ncbi:MAG: CDP-alcohol phosphatidyltransferase family protein [Pseudomonadota bacterium]
MNQPRSVAFPPQAMPLAAWSRAQALAMTATLGTCAWQGQAWPVAVSALITFTALLWLGRHAYTPSGRFGSANTVTGVRLIVLLTLTLPPRLLPAWCALTIALSVLGLDLLDGWLARRASDTSAFGAHFDMETDALLVLVVTLRLWLGQGYEPWVLVAGYLRYAYVLGLWGWSGSGREAPRSRFGRWAFGLLMLGLCSGLVLSGLAGRISVALGTLAVSVSFARSYYFSRHAS